MSDAIGNIDPQLKMAIEKILSSGKDQDAKTTAARDLMEQFAPDKVIGALMQMAPMIAAALSG